MIGEGCYEKHMRRDAITSNVTEQVYARVHGCTRDRVYICIKYTYSETASYEATSVETSYSDNCYYRVTRLIRSIKCKGRRSKSYEHRYTIPVVLLCLYHNHMSTHKYDFLQTCKIVPHELENFEPHEIATSSRQTFRINLLLVAEER